jgi:ArsR family transcriptional regulator
MNKEKEYIRVFRAFSDKNRIRVLELLCDGEQCACILLEDMKINQSTLSHHMKILCDSGIVKGRRVGKWIYYSINTDGCKYASRLLNIIANHKFNTTLKFAGTAHRMLSAFKGRSCAKESSQNDVTCCCSK